MAPIGLKAQVQGELSISLQGSELRTSALGYGLGLALGRFSASRLTALKLKSLVKVVVVEFAKDVLMMLGNEKVLEATQIRAKCSF